jgi:hypothetical protein
MIRASGMKIPDAFLFPKLINELKPAAGIGVKSLPTKVGINWAHSSWRELVAISMT